MRFAGPLLVALCALLVALALPAGAHAKAGCDAVASTAGSDSAPGTESQPFRTVKRLSDALRAGQTGCIRAGTYHEHLRVSRGGAEGLPVTLRSFPGERAKLVGRLHVAEGADHVTIADLDLDGRNPNDLPSPTVNAAYTTFSGNDVTNGHTAICFNLGHKSWGQAVGTVIDSNRIHNCGKLPSTNLDHGIYVGWSDRVQITGNAIYDNADRGVQLYPDAQRTTIRGNVIDGNGVGIIFSGDGGVASNDTLVEGNIISFSRIRHDVESWYPTGNPVGSGNVVRGNCIYGGARGEIQSPQVGFTATDNLIADPKYVDRSGKDFRLTDGSPCASFLAGSSPTPPAEPDPPVEESGPPEEASDPPVEESDPPEEASDPPAESDPPEEASDPPAELTRPGRPASPGRSSPKVRSSSSIQLSSSPSPTAREELTDTDATVLWRLASRWRARTARVSILAQVRGRRVGGRQLAPPRRALIQVRVPGRWRSVALSRVRANGRLLTRLSGHTVRRRAGIRTTRRLTTWVRVRVAGGASRPLRARI